MRVEIQAPSSLNDITLRQYQRFHNLKEPTSADVISIFLNFPDEYINKIAKNSLDSVASQIIEMFNQECKMMPTFRLKGVKYGFIPKLNDISFGEYTDATAYLSDWNKIHKSMAVLYRPVTSQKKDKYLIEDYEGSAKYADVFLDMPVSVVMGCMVFFYSLLNDLLRAIPHYLLKQMDPEQLGEMISLKSGDNMGKYTQSVRETLEDLKRLPNLGFMSA